MITITLPANCAAILRGSKPTDWTNSKIIPAIKAAREAFGVGLKEAKDLIDGVIQSPWIVPPWVHRNAITLFQAQMRRWGVEVEVTDDEVPAAAAPAPALESLFLCSAKISSYGYSEQTRLVAATSSENAEEKFRAFFEDSIDIREFVVHETIR